MRNTLKRILPFGARLRYLTLLKEMWMNCNTFFGKATRVVMRPKFPVNVDGSINIHLGCGEINHPSFVNIDLISLPHIHYVRRIDNLSPFRDDSVSLVYACHCLEHFMHKKVYLVIQEWHRVLKKGGVLRLSVPDFDLLLTIYDENEKDIEQIALVLMGGQDYKYNFHYTVFNEKRMAELLTQAGFTNVKKWIPGETDITTFDDWSKGSIEVNGKDYPVSLNLQATKV